MGHVQRTGHRADHFVKVAIGRTPARGSKSGPVGQQKRRFLEVSGHAQWWLFGQLPVVGGVISDRMAPVQQVLYLITPPTGRQVPTQEEERGAGAVSIQQVQQDRGEELIGTIVEGQVDDAGVSAD
jgi:hypothetical protein